MNRRSYLAGVSGASGLLAGCTDALVLGDPGVSPREPPDRPADLTPESVAAYVAECEEVRVHNLHAERGVSEVTVRTAATFDHAVGGDHYATVRHAGTVSEDADGTQSVGELSGPPTPYLVTPDLTLRFDLDRRTVGPGLDGSTNGDDAVGEPVSPPLGVRLLNATEDDREVSVTVRRRADGDSTDADGEEPVARSTESVPAESAIELRSIADARGGYRVVARTTDDETTAEGRIEVGIPGADRAVGVDVAVDGDGVSTHRLPPLEPL